MAKLLRGETLEIRLENGYLLEKSCGSMLVDLRSVNQQCHNSWQKIHDWVNNLENCESFILKNFAVYSSTDIQIMSFH